MDSILTCIKKLLGIEEDNTDFDTDVIIHINSALSILTHLGCGPEDGVIISSKEDEWSSFIDDLTTVEMVKTYVYAKVKLVFDPPTNPTVLEALKATAAELEWRIPNIYESVVE